jgi:hypothetical protein
MTAPRPGPGFAPDLSAVQDYPRREVRARRALGGWARAASARLAGPARLAPGLAAAGCAVAGAWLLWSLGVALLVAAGLLLLVDARTPRG